MSKHIVETTEKVDLISQEGKMVVVKKECNALIDDEIIKHLTGQIKLTSSKDDLIKYLENKSWELKEENQQLKDMLKDCYKMLAQYHVENSEPSIDENIELLTKIDNVIGEKK